MVYSHIEKSAFRLRQYVGYFNGVWHIRKASSTRWVAIARDGQWPHTICSTTLKGINAELVRLEGGSKRAHTHRLAQGVIVSG